MVNLAYNTVDVASSVNSVYRHQVLSNFGRLLDEPYALPSQIDLATGTVQTTYSVTPSVTAPASSAVTKNGAGVVTQSVLSGVGLSLNANDSWQQNWNVIPITDANTLRNLRAIYRYALFSMTYDEFKAEYHQPRSAANGISPDPYMLEEPQCVFCQKAPSKGSPKYINPALRSGWLYWTGSDFSGREKLPPPGALSLGQYGQHELFMLPEDYYKGYLSNFTLFVLPTAVPSGGAAGGGGKGGGGGANGPRPPQLDVPEPRPRFDVPRGQRPYIPPGIQQQ